MKHNSGLPTVHLNQYYICCRYTFYYSDCTGNRLADNEVTQPVMAIIPLLTPHSHTVLTRVVVFVCEWKYKYPKLTIAYLIPVNIKTFKNIDNPYIYRLTDWSQD